MCIWFGVDPTGSYSQDVDGMIQETALSLYHRFVAVIDEAAAECNIFAVPEAAIAAGLEGTEEPRAMGHRWDYSYADAGRATVSVHARYWDQSQAFSIRPDMHRMSVTWEDGAGTKLHHERSYEE